MAGNTVELVLAGDSRSLEKAFSNAGTSALDAGNDFDKASGKAHSFGGAMDTAGGAADASESKFIGAADVLSGLGGAFGLPTEGAAGLLMSFGDLSGGFAAIQPLIGSVTGLISGGLSSALTLISSHPIIATMTLLIGAFILAYTHSETFRNIVNNLAATLSGVVLGAVNAVKDAFVGAFNWVKDNWPYLLGILTGPFGLAIVAIAKNWDTIRGFFTDFMGFLNTVWGGIRDAISAPFTGAFNAIKSLWNSTVGGFGFKTPEFGIGPLHTPSIEIRIPRMHTGGIVGEGLPIGTEVPIMAMAGEGITPIGAAGGMGNVTIIVKGHVLDGRDLGRLAQSALLERQGRTGNLGITAA